MDWLINKKLAFHIHTKYSPDSLSSPKEIIDILFNFNFNAVIITDHNTIEGALIAKQYAEKKYPTFHVIIGEEISTDIGDVIAFPLNENIKENTFVNVIISAKKMGALICMPHPYEAHDLQKIHTPEILDKIDFIEVNNSRINFEQNTYAIQYAEFYKKKKIVGTDAHLLKELYNNYNYFKSIEENEYTIIKYSKKRYIRLSQLITYYRERNFAKIFKYLFLYVVNK